MAADRPAMEALLSNVLELKNKENMESSSFLALLSMVNLMGLIELINEESGKPQARKQGDLLLPFGRVPVNKG
ncbi:MAG: hypothetical protein FH756_05420 [Firmicutes bacterium]|nr:hypothetical protein [Bacillota bacterium]